MPIVALGDLQPGAVLSQPVYSSRGIMLAPEGAVLSETHLAIFASWGVASVTIAGDDLPLSQAGELDDEQVSSIQQLVEDRFSLVVPMFPFMREVQRVTEQILMKRPQASAEERPHDGSHGS